MPTVCSQALLRLLRGGMLLAALMGCVPGLWPGLFALVAQLDGSHAVETRIDEEGVRVVLMHGVGNARRPHDAVHRHCVLAKALTLLASDDRGTPDHVLSFAGSPPRVLGERLAVAAPAISSADAAPVGNVVMEVARPSAPRVAEGLWRTARSSVPPAGFVGLKSTLLLI